MNASLMVDHDRGALELPAFRCHKVQYTGHSESNDCIVKRSIFIFQLSLKDVIFNLYTSVPSCVYNLEFRYSKTICWSIVFLYWDKKKVFQNWLINFPKRIQYVSRRWDNNNNQS